MMLREQIPEPWKSFLHFLDAGLHDLVALHCFGSFVVTMFYELARATVDLEAI